MKTHRIFAILIVVILASTQINGQELKVEQHYAINIDELPEYVVVTSENTKLLGGININIDHKKSDYEEELKTLESLLQNRRKLRIRTQTDLLNAMSKLGFAYVNAYNGRSSNIGGGSGDDIEIFGSHEKFRINMVFKKKDKYQG